MLIGEGVKNGAMKKKKTSRKKDKINTEKKKAKQVRKFTHSLAHSWS
jgi:hypothetical protein